MSSPFPIRNLLLFPCFLLGLITAFAQTIPVGFPVLEEYARRAQLLGKLDSTVSFTLRPLQLETLAAAMDSAAATPVTHWKVLWASDKLKARVTLLPFQFRTEYNSHHPYGWNNGLMIPNRGIQTLVSAGVYAKLGPLSIQLYPEYVYAQNREFEGFPDAFPDQLWIRRYVNDWNRIDQPERFGDRPQHLLSPGQSSVRLNYRSLSLGISNENLWWGPGKYNSLTMSNNARGFTHLTFNTTRPFRTPIGTFEGQLIAGILKNSVYRPPLPDRTSTDWLVKRSGSDRYLNALNVSYHPKWISGLTLGAIRSFQTYLDSARKNDDYLPIFSMFFREKDPVTDHQIGRDQISTVFARWLWRQANAELYAEFGRNDASWNLRDFGLSPEHSRAYTFGIAKIFKLTDKNQYFEFQFETTHLEKSGTRVLRPEPFWYNHARPNHGYTHSGEVVGAGIGTSGNSQLLSIHWISCLNKLGFYFERYLHNEDWFKRISNLKEDANWNRVAYGPDEPLGSWVDLSFGASGSVAFKRMAIEGKLQGIRSLNYQWELLTDPNASPKTTGRDVFNLHASVNLIYILD